MQDPKVQALATHLGVTDLDTIEECRYGSDTYECSEAPGEYMVLTDDEADAAWDESLDNYIDECVLCEIPGAYRKYFDSAAFKRDARHDGRGHTLSGYDGEENEEKIDGVYYYIYRTN